MERVDGIEPTSSAWKAAALPLCYTRATISICQKILETALFKIFCLYIQVAELAPTGRGWQPETKMVVRAGFEPAYALAGRFTVCCH